jgi:hypothetical protein
MLIEGIKQLLRYHKLKALYKKYERVLMPGALVLGVIVDAITFASIKIGTALLILFWHLIVAGMAIIYLNAYDVGKVKNTKWFGYLRLITPLVIQFTFGALLSASFIFYFFSGSIWVSWPFILILTILMVSNDVFRQQYLRPGVQVSVYFFILFTLMSIALPFAFSTIGVGIFLFSGVLSLGLIYIYFILLSKFRAELLNYKKKFAKRILIIFVVINGLYFFNLIPPIPLTLRESVVAHSVKRVGNMYDLVVEKQNFWQRLAPGQTFHKLVGDKVVVYTSVFAPKDLETGIVHHWQLYDPKENKWITKDKLSFSITGGRQAGYRGFSSKSVVPEGKWRVDVETSRGQVLGRVRFKVQDVEDFPEFISVSK